jgi:hypothetical protein
MAPFDKEVSRRNPLNKISLCYMVWNCEFGLTFTFMTLSASTLHTNDW